MGKGGKAPRQKGVRAERSLSKILKNAGLPAKRVPLSGQAEGFKGDVLLGDMDLEVKAGWHVPERLYSWLSTRYALALKRPYKGWLIVMRLEDWIKLLKKEEVS